MSIIKSIMSNIAEGFDRFSSREFIRFLIIARGSISEVQNDLYIALDLKYISQKEFQLAYNISFLAFCISRLQLANRPIGELGN